MNLLSKTDTFHYVPNIALLAQWKVEADENYNIIYKKTLPNDYIVIRTSSGKGKLILTDNSEFDLDQDTLFIINSDRIKRYYCVIGRWCFDWFRFKSCPVVAQISGKVYHIKIEKTELENINNCFVLIGLNTAYSSLEASAVFTLLVTRWLTSINNKQNNKQSYFEELILNAKKNMSKNYTIKELACSLHMCERNFRRQFEKYTGMSPKKYIEKQKLDSALELLTTTNMRIKEISEIHGFSDQYYFSKIFLKHFGKSPQKFRDNITEKE